MSKNYLVTGGAGFIGAAIVRKMLSSGHKVKILDNLQRGNVKKFDDLDHEIEFITADIRDTEKVVKASKNCDGIIHLAYVNGTKYFYSKPELVLDIAVKGMQSVIEAGKINGTPELFLASSSEVYQTPDIVPTPESVQLVIPDPYNPRFSYGGGKILCELMAIHMGKEFFKKIIIFRPHNVYGPEMGEEHVIPEFIRRINGLMADKKTNFEIQGSGQETRSYICIDDFADGFMLLLSKGKNLTTYNIGTDNEIKSIDLASQIADIYNYKISFDFIKLQKGSTPRRCPDITKIKKLGFKPNIPLIDGLQRTIEWYNNHPK